MANRQSVAEGMVLLPIFRLLVIPDLEIHRLPLSLEFSDQSGGVTGPAEVAIMGKRGFNIRGKGAKATKLKLIPVFTGMTKWRPDGGEFR